MTGSCPVSAHVCQETARERGELSRWKAEALPVSEGLQELGKALGLPLGSRITGQEALAAVEHLTRERDEERRALDNACERVVALLRERDEARAEVERLRAGIERLTRVGYRHTPYCERERESARLDRHADCGRCWEDSLHILLNPTEGETDD